MVQRAGRIWFSAEDQRPPLVGGEFADGWTLLGYVHDNDRPTLNAEWRRSTASSRGRSLEFYVLAGADVDVTALPAKAWLGFDRHGADGTSRLVSATRATLHAPLRHRVPERHPGLIGPHKPVAVKITTSDGASFQQ